MLCRELVKFNHSDEGDVKRPEMVLFLARLGCLGRITLDDDDEVPVEAKDGTSVQLRALLRSLDKDDIRSSIACTGQ